MGGGNIIRRLVYFFFRTRERSHAGQGKRKDTRAIATNHAVLFACLPMCLGVPIYLSYTCIAGTRRTDMRTRRDIFISVSTGGLSSYPLQ